MLQAVAKDLILLFFTFLLLQLGRHKEALDFAFAAQCLSPSNSEVAEKVESIKRDLAAGKILFRT